MALLSKSDFKLAQTCPTKLYYKKHRYPSTAEDDEYLELLAEGGFMVEKIAKLLHADGRDLPITADSNAAAAETLRALAADSVTLFEATFIHDGRLARVDILQKERENERIILNVIEVKAKSYDSRENAVAVARGTNIFRSVGGEIRSEWQEYLEDIAFQVAVIQDQFPQAIIHAFLAMPDKAKTTTIDRLHSLFSLSRVREGTGFERLVVDFTGDIATLRANHFLEIVPVDREVRDLLPLVRQQSRRYATSLQPTVTRVVTRLTTACKECEFRSSDRARDGFRECWGQLADVQPHLLDLYHVSQVGGRNRPIANNLIAQGRVSLFDMPIDELVRTDGTVGETNRRQRTQIEHTRSNTEWISPELGTLLQSLPRPLHFIDFETATLAIPYHAGMHPYEEVAFQWSCHTIQNDGSVMHREWINVVDAFPNFDFAHSLMECVGDDGTLLTWATHERTILTRIGQQMLRRRHSNDRLQSWIADHVEQHGRQSHRIVDLNEVTRKYYFHPVMKGRTSVKRVCDAVWRANPRLREEFPQYLSVDGDAVLSPYETLPSLQIAGVPVVVVEGTGAIRAYEAMVYGVERNDPSTLEAWKSLLLQYCKLDTLAMVMVWKHWTERCSL